MDSSDKTKDMYLYTYKSLVIAKLEIEPGRGKKAIKLTRAYNFNAVTLPSSTISFCNTLDFIIKTLIAWKYTKRSFSAYIYENTPCRGRQYREE